MKNRNKPPSCYKSKTNFFSKLLLFLGLVSIIIFLIGYLSNGYLISKDLSMVVLAFGVLFIGIGLLAHVLFCQFRKLDEIARDIEKQ